MLRKDLRVGLGIGAVLLLVLVVALVVKSNGKKTHPIDPESNEEVATNTPGTSSIDPTGGIGTGGPVEPTPAPIKPVDPFVKDPAIQTAGTGANDWESLLSGRTDSTAKLSETPTPGAPRGTPAPGGATAGLNPLQAATGGSRSAPPLPSNILLDPPAAPPAGTPRSTPRTSPPAPVGHKTHIVTQGETFSSISRSAYGNAKYYLQIAKANPNLNPNALKPGATVILPDITGDTAQPAPRISGSGGATRAPAPAIGFDRTREYKVESGDSLYKISQKLYGDVNRVDAIYELNKQAIGPDPRRLKLGMILKLAEPPSPASGR